MSTHVTDTSDPHNTINILVVEDDPVMQQRLLGIVALAQLGSANIVLCGTVSEADEHIKTHTVSLALVDLGLPDGNGLTVIERLVQRQPDSSILVISAWSDEDAILSALSKGATGYILKERDDMEVMVSIRNVLRGGAPIDPFIARRILKHLRTDESHANSANQDATTSPQTAQTPTAANPVAPLKSALTARESEILEYVGNGMSNKEIAKKLQLSRYTVEGHIKNIYKKLSVSSRTKAVVTAKSLGYL